MTHDCSVRPPVGVVTRDVDEADSTHVRRILVPVLLDSTLDEDVLHGAVQSGDSTQVMDQRMFVDFHETEAQRQMKRTEGRDEGRAELLSLAAVVMHEEGLKTCEETMEGNAGGATPVTPTQKPECLWRARRRSLGASSFGPHPLCPPAPFCLAIVDMKRCRINSVPLIGNAPGLQV
ncbi:hypothetical protein EYF80_036900 [Liparis tanakae]|uniref:Uncharacterized protein n=1 Tax=Liparis tanakae TaxID=230148 RepID=A0A4Z2GH65_9TELE|nr:hypothetical protein EYF80_036900 [Liparis tanakae]